MCWQQNATIQRDRFNVRRIKKCLEHRQTFYSKKQAVRCWVQQHFDSENQFHKTATSYIEKGKAVWCSSVLCKLSWCSRHCQVLSYPNLTQITLALMLSCPNDESVTPSRLTLNRSRRIVLPRPAVRYQVLEQFPC